MDMKHLKGDSPINCAYGLIATEGRASKAGTNYTSPRLAGKRIFGQYPAHGERLQRSSVTGPAQGIVRRQRTCFHESSVEVDPGRRFTRSRARWRPVAPPASWQFA